MLDVMTHTPPHASSPPVERTPAWDDHTLSDPHRQADKAARIERMFDAIAPTYEKVNRVASLGRDAVWRRAAVAAADVRPNDLVLDIACGTGDMIRTFARQASPKRIIGLDFAAGMLARGTYGGIETRIDLIRGDALRLPLADESVDVVSCTFGVRNFQDLQAGLNEMHRVMRPGGRVVILEFALPEFFLFRWPYRLYTELILPRIGRWISRDKTGAYAYLPKSVGTFDRLETLIKKLELAGFSSVTARPMNLGGVVLYRGEKHG